MPTYLVTGASRGLGFEFLNQLSQDKANTVVGLVRNKEATEMRVKAELGDRGNIHIVSGDIANYESLKTAINTVDKIADGKLDYLIANAGFISSLSAFCGLGKLASRPDELEADLLDSFKVNVVGNVHLFNLCIPLIRGGSAKKVIALSSGHADLDSVNSLGLEMGGSYAISKSAMNLVVAKFNAEYSNAGILFMSISPGVVDTGNYRGEVTEEVRSTMRNMFAKFVRYAPDFKGPSSPQAAVSDVLNVMHKSSLAHGDGGAFLSHYGNKKWL